MPCFAREGAIIPLSLDEGNSCKNPTVLKFKVYRGNGSFSLYEDDGETNGFKDGDFSITELSVSETENGIKLTLCGGKEKGLSSALKGSMCLSFPTLYPQRT